MSFLLSLFGGGSGGPKKRKLIPVKVEKRFDLRGKTGQGSMSKVFQAYDREIGRTVALKILDRVKTKRFEERFKGLSKPGEGEICLGLKHKNIVQTYAEGITTEQDPFLVMEWVEGNGLNYHIETKSKLLAEHGLDWIIQMAEALDYLHGEKFLHRDVCPRNAMIGPDNVLKMIDFGLTVPWTPSFTKPGNRTGSTDYLAPEIIKRQETDNRVDLFALGVTAFEMFTGGLPWDRSGSSEDKLRRRINTPAKDPKEFKPDLDDALANLLRKAVERDREKRFPTARAFRDAFRALKPSEDE
jgi:serine/threonine protein kinase